MAQLRGMERARYVARMFSRITPSYDRMNTVMSGGRREASERIDFTVADAHSLPFADDSFVCATVGFGVRNFVDLPRALSEMARVVAPGGRVVTLEIVRTGRGPLGRLFPLYFRHATPWLGALLARDREAYTYLPESVQGFLTVEEVTALMENAGLVNIEVRKLAFGTVAIHSAQVPR